MGEVDAEGRTLDESFQKVSDRRDSCGFLNLINEKDLFELIYTLLHKVKASRVQKS